jgi:enamine deaminase RidA (YjgF/YER057c/UK114 family)
MNGRTVVEVPGLPDSTGKGYTQCVVAGDFIFVAGQTGVDEHYNVISDEFGPQARQALHNVELALKAAGADLSHIVAMTVWLTDMQYKDEFTAIRKEVLGDNLAPSALIGGARLAFPTLYVEIQVTAYRPQ